MGDALGQNRSLRIYLGIPVERKIWVEPPGDGQKEKAPSQNEKAPIGYIVYQNSH